MHFNGTMHDECRAGVKYDDVQVAGKGLPCIRGTKPFDRGESLQCDKRRWHTDEEIRQRVAESDASMERFMLAMAVIHADMEQHGYGKGNGGISEVICPNCSKTLRYSVAGYNGHIHARCETDGCVAFMQ